MQVLHSPKKRRKSVVHSFRLSEEWFNILCEEAEKQDVNCNALMNKVLKHYCLHHRHTKRFAAINLTSPLFAEIINFNSEENLKEVAKKYGLNGPKDALRTFGVTPTFDHLIDFINKYLGEFGGWFDVTHYTKHDTEILHLRHNVGRKWSFFVAELISTIFEQILDKKMTAEIFDDFVTCYIPR